MSTVMCSRTPFSVLCHDAVRGKSLQEGASSSVLSIQSSNPNKLAIMLTVEKHLLAALQGTFVTQKLKN